MWFPIQKSERRMTDDLTNSPSSPSLSLLPPLLLPLLWKRLLLYSWKILEFTMYPSNYEMQASFEFSVLLPPPPDRWDHKYVPPRVPLFYCAMVLWLWSSNCALLNSWKGALMEGIEKGFIWHLFLSPLSGMWLGKFWHRVTGIPSVEMTPQLHSTFKQSWLFPVLFWIKNTKPHRSLHYALSTLSELLFNKIP